MAVCAPCPFEAAVDSTAVSQGAEASAPSAIRSRAFGRDPSAFLTWAVERVCAEERLGGRLGSYIGSHCKALACAKPARGANPSCHGGAGQRSNGDSHKPSESLLVQRLKERDHIEQLAHSHCVAEIAHA
jgi:hypothetical protein